MRRRRGKQRAAFAWRVQKRGQPTHRVGCDPVALSLLRGRDEVVVAGPDAGGVGRTVRGGVGVLRDGRQNAVELALLIRRAEFGGEDVGGKYGEGDGGDKAFHVRFLVKVVEVLQRSPLCRAPPSA